VGRGGVTASWPLLEPEPSRSEEGEVTKDGVAREETEGEWGNGMKAPGSSAEGERAASVLGAEGQRLRCTGLD
jgi:hypothetical protein